MCHTDKARKTWPCYTIVNVEQFPFHGFVEVDKNVAHNSQSPFFGYALVKPARDKGYKVTRVVFKMYWKNAFRWIVAQIHIIALFAADSPEHYNGYLRRGLSKAESWLRGDDSGNKYFNLRMYWQKGYK